MTREEAINEIKSWAIPSEKGREVLETLIPELAESDDERIRRTLVEYFGPKVQLDFVRGIPIQKIRDWLEKQKDIEDRWIEDRGQCFWDGVEEGKMLAEKQKEQNDEDEECTDFTIYHPLKNGKGKYECIPYSFYGSLTSFSEDKDLIDFLRTCFYTKEECNEWIEQQKEPHYTKRNALFDKCVENCDPAVMKSVSDEVDEMLEKEQKPAEWSEEDEKMLRTIISDGSRGVELDSKQISWLKPLRPSWKPTEEQMKALEDAFRKDGSDEYRKTINSLYQDLKKL